MQLENAVKAIEEEISLLTDIALLGLDIRCQQARVRLGISQDIPTDAAENQRVLKGACAQVGQHVERWIAAPEAAFQEATATALVQEAIWDILGAAGWHTTGEASRVMAAIQDVIWDVLQTAGWKKDEFVPAATKEIPSYVGLKMATIWVCEYFDQAGNFRVFAEYWSEGRNVAACGQLIHMTDNLDQVRSKLERYLDWVDEVISNSYAVRLLKAS